jgi:hypothetical protein
MVDWEKRETKENVLLRMSIKDNIIPHITDWNKYKETWDTLKGFYETTNKLSIVFKEKITLN